MQLYGLDVYIVPDYSLIKILLRIPNKSHLILASPEASKTNTIGVTIGTLIFTHA